MKDTLKRFTTEDLREASFCLLNKLGLKYNKASRTPITLDSLYNEKKTEQENFVYGHVKKAYFVAALNQNSFTNPNLDAALNVETDNVEKDDKYSSMLVFALEVDDEANVDGKLFRMTRTNCAVLTRLFNKISNSLPVVLFIKQNDKLHISTCERSSYKRNHYNGEKLGKVSMLMGINCANAHTGHCRILGKRMVSPSVHGFDDLYRHWLDKFNTKTLTEDFYTDLYKWFMWVVYDDNAKFPENSHLSKAENEEKNTKVIRLITRLMFVWFLKEKRFRKEGETSGLVPDCIFDVNKLKDILADFDADSATEGNYYNAILQNLFFATLNNEVEARRFVDTPFQGRSKGYMVKVLFRDNKKKSWFRISHDEVLRIFEKVPYLNCGLFECLDKYKRTDISYDKDRIFDGFSTRDDSNYRTCLPNRLFFADELPEKKIKVVENGKTGEKAISSRGIIKIFEDYVFTVEENTPMDQQVSLDPELLGKVFENLLAAYNPETSSEARKSSGSFYTPREIVEYMVTESLIQYLKTSLNDGVEEEQLRNLVSSEEKGFELKEVQTEKILEALYQCKVLDPACGSGAFPMGMLQQMVHVIERLDEKNEKWKEIITKIAKNSSAKAYENDSIQDEERKERVDEIHRIFTYSKNNPCYARKLFLIQNCLFGVDIQPIAMMISKLRFFISLICEQDEDSVDFDDKKNNYHINTLPNLETKFVAANSLLTADIHKFSGDWTNDQHLEQLKDELMELRRLHFSAKSQSEKLKIRTRDEQKRMEIIDYILSTQAHADQEKISLLQDQINHLAIERKAYEGEKIVDEYCDAQTSLFDAPQPTLFHRDVNKAKREEIDRQILRCQAEITREQSKENIVGFEAAVKQITDWNPYDQIKASPFFDSDWMFGVKVDADSGVGFDIVIGNPPYLRIQGIREANPKFADYLSAHYLSATGSFDLCVTFVERGLNLISPNGIVNYIMPTKWTNSAFGKGLRKIVSKSKSASKIINFGAYQVFNASTYTGLQWFTPNNQFLKYFELDRDLSSNEELKQYLDSLDDYQVTIINQEELSETQWVLINNKVAEVLNRLNQHPRRIKDIFDKIFQGLATSKDDVYFIYDCRVDDDYIIGESKQLGRIVQIERGLVKPLLKGDDVHRYDTIKTDRYVIFPYKIQNGKALLYTESELEELYPKGFEYLKECENVLREREKGRFNIDGEWFQFGRKQGILYAEKEKLVAPDISMGGNFAYDCQGEFYQTTTIYGYIKKQNVQESYKFWMALLNSRLFWWYLVNTGTVLANGFFRFKPDYVNPFPVPQTISKKAEQSITILVDYILTIKSLPNDFVVDEYVDKDTIIRQFERVIDALIYELYFPNEFMQANISFADIVPSTFAPVKSNDINEAVIIINKSFELLSDMNNEIRNNLKYMSVKLETLLAPIINV